MIVGFLVPWSGHTDASSELAQDIASALDAAFGKREAAAAAMGIHPADLSHQLSGRDPLNAWRLAGLGVRFWFAFLTARAKRIGADVVSAETLSLIRGAAAMGPRMVSAVLRKGRAA